MMNALGDKILSDLWQQKVRTLQVVLIIAMGAFAIGMIIGTRDYIIQGMAEFWQQSSPAMIQLGVTPAVDDDTLLALQRVDGVTDVEGFAQTALEWRTSTADSWRPGRLITRADYDNQVYARLTLVSGKWPKKKALAVVQGGDTQYGIAAGNQIHVRMGDRKFSVPVNGIISDPTAQPPSFGGLVQFYVTRDRFADMTGERNFNRILAGASQWDEARVTAIADAMQEKLEKQGIDSSGASPYGSRVSDPTKHYFQDGMDAVFYIMGAMAGLALILGLFLVYNTITAVISRQISQIGILKAIGAGAQTIFSIYLAIVFAYGLLALMIAVPLGAMGARLLGAYLMDAFNAEGVYEQSPVAIAAQVAIALLSPLLASLVPLFAGARITVREAISHYGLQANISLLDRLLAHIQALPQLLSLTISNTFRHKRRVLLTQITLVLSGLIFMTVMSARDTTRYTFDDILFSILQFNVNIQFEEAERIDRVENLTLEQPGVKAVEMWGLMGSTIRRTEQPESNDDQRASLFGVPLPTTLYRPQLRAGRWLLPDDQNAVVLNQQLAEDVGVNIGEWVTLDHGVKGESTWRVVGLLFDPIITNSAHVARDQLQREIGGIHRASTVWIQTEQDDATSEASIARQLREMYTQHKLKPHAISVFGQDTASKIVSNILGQFAVIVTLLAVMAVVIGAVGSIALSGVLSLNVIERQKEIGMLRAIGATSKYIAGLFVGEGLILGWLSWLIALPLSIPAGRLMASGLGHALDVELVYQRTFNGAFLWLMIVTVLAVAASWLPARSAIRVSVRESLVYE